MPHTPQKHHLETVTKNFHGPGAFAIRKPKVAILVGIIICVWGMLFFPHLSFAFSDVSEEETPSCTRLSLHQEESWFSDLEEKFSVFPLPETIGQSDHGAISDYQYMGSGCRVGEYFVFSNIYGLYSYNVQENNLVRSAYPYIYWETGVTKLYHNEEKIYVYSALGGGSSGKSYYAEYDYAQNKVLLYKECEIEILTTEEKEHCERVEQFFPKNSSVYSQFFSDVSEDHPNYEAIEWAKENGIVKGFEDGTFRPEQRVTRAELIKIIFGAHQKTRGNKKNCFPDVKEEWFSPYVCKAKNEKFINGFPDGNFKPHKNISFVAAAKIIANVMSDEEIVEDEEIWYANYVQFLSDKKAIPVSILELDKEITRGEVVEIVWRLKEDKKNQKSRWFENGNFYYRIEAGIIYAGVEKIGIGNRGGKYFDFQPTEIDGFEVLGFDYWKNKDEIYYGNLSLQQNILNNTNIHLNNIDAETFEVLNHIYAKDKNNIYYKDSYIYDNNVDEDGNVSDLHHTSVYVWENIDNEGIEILGNFYAKYNGEIYVTKFVGRNNTQPIVRKIESADPTTFQIIENSNEYDAEDKNAYYQNGVMVKEKEIKTQKIDLSFENHDKSGELRCSCRHNGCCTIRYSLPYFISNGSVYYLEDGVSLEFINLTYEETMEQAKKIENADPATFKIIKDSDEYDAQDKNHKYLHGKIVE